MNGDFRDPQPLNGRSSSSEPAKEIVTQERSTGSSATLLYWMSRELTNEDAFPFYSAALALLKNQSCDGLSTCTC